MKKKTQTGAAVVVTMTTVMRNKLMVIITLK